MHAKMMLFDEFDVVCFATLSLSEQYLGPG